MTSMVEKVARAMIAVTPGASGKTDELLSDATSRRIWLDTARAAIEAMMEPTERMIWEGESAASFGLGKPADEEALPRVWKWMIQAALKETQG